MKKIFTFILILTFIPLLPVQANTPVFADIKGHWAEDSINSAAKMGLISGLPVGTFAPNSPITLSEVITMLVPLVSGERPEITNNENWYLPYAKTAFDLGLMEGFSHDELDGFYNSPALRMMVNVLFANTLVSLDLANKYNWNDELTKKSLLGLKSFTDSDDILNNLYICSTYSCVAHGLVKGNEKRELMPYSYMTRAEAVTMLLRIKAYQVQRLNGMHYVDPFSYSDYSFTCVKTAGGKIYPIEDAGRSVIRDNGKAYLTIGGIIKILEACEVDFDIHETTPGDIYEGFYDSYASIYTTDFYSYINTDDSLYGYSNTYTGYIENHRNRKYDFICAAESDSGLVINNTPMLPIDEVLNFFNISYKSITTDIDKASVIVDFGTV